MIHAELIRWSAAHPITGQRTPPRYNGFIQYAPVLGMIYQAERDLYRSRWVVTPSLAHLSPDTPLQTYDALYALPAWPGALYLPILAKEQDPTEGLSTVSAAIARRTKAAPAWDLSVAAWLSAPADPRQGKGYWLAETRPGYWETYIPFPWFGADVNRVAYAQRFTREESGAQWSGWISRSNDGLNYSDPIRRKPEALAQLRLLTEETIQPWLTRARAEFTADSHAVRL